MVIWVNIFQTEEITEIQLVRPAEVCGKVRKMAKSLFRNHFYSQMLLMQTTKTAVCLQTKAISHHLYVFQLVFWLNFMSSTLLIALTKLLE